jgi:hypothetical protein
MLVARASLLAVPFSAMAFSRRGPFEQRSDTTQLNGQYPNPRTLLPWQQGYDQLCELHGRLHGCKRVYPLYKPTRADGASSVNSSIESGRRCDRRQDGRRAMLVRYRVRTRVCLSEAGQRLFNFLDSGVRPQLAMQCEQPQQVELRVPMHLHVFGDPLFSFLDALFGGLHVVKAEEITGQIVQHVTPTRRERLRSASGAAV